MKLRVIPAIAFSAALAFSMVGCAGGASSSSSSASSESSAAEESSSASESSAGESAEGIEVESSSAETAEIGNPWKSYTTIGEAEKAVGFDIELPIELKAGDTISAMEGLIEVVMPGSYGGTTFRKGVGEQDVSGVYNEYPFSTSADTVVVKGDASDKIKLATWYAGDYSYSISTTNGITISQMNDLIAGTN